MRPRVTQSVAYVLRKWVSTAVILFRSHLYFFVQRKTLQRVVAKEQPYEEADEWTLYLGTGLVSDISWLILYRTVGGKGIPYFRKCCPGEFFCHCQPLLGLGWG